jgi:hypothetical protein
MSEAKVDNGKKEFDTLIENLDNTMTCTSASNKPNPLLCQSQEGTDWQ